MKITLEYNMTVGSGEGKDDIQDYHYHMAGPDACAILWDLINNKIRNQLKYENLTDEASKVYEDIRQWVVEEIQEHGISHLFQ